MWQVRDRALSTAAGTLLMGVLNVTPDSFSDGGRHADLPAAAAHGRRLAAAGADLVDVGGESTRPGAPPVGAHEEARRVVPVVAELVAAGVAVSVDTSKASVAAAALAEGAVAVNDVTALADPEMAGVVAEAGAGLVLMHMQGTPRTMQREPHYNDVVAEVAEFLEKRSATAIAAGVAPERICIDPGIGFGKTPRHNLRLLRHLDVFVALGHPVLVGTSRKSTIAALVGSEDLAARDEGTAATVALAIGAGAAVLRVHNVAMARRVAQVADAIVRAEFAGMVP